mmetsp:Transcript_4283/g.6682  ORF Transcript_4283/g.6682 Transcript_4283/m.6682 type:complete len:577 (+) Transcript_4283:80-1810(+)
MLPSSSRGCVIKITEDLKKSLNAPSLGADPVYQQVNLVPLRKKLESRPSSPSVKNNIQNLAVGGTLNETGSDLRTALPPPKSTCSETSTEEAGSSTKEQNNVDFSFYEEKKPVVVVNLERLCGYIPKKGTELDAVKDQVEEVFSNDDDFEERVIELYEMDIARHADTSEVFVVDEIREISVNYPAFLCPNDGRTLSTTRLWKKINQKHKIEVVQRVLCHLTNCNKSLVWKSDMQDELLALTDRELDAKRNFELDRWRSEGRKQRLDKLYQVRETFSYRLETARIHVEELEDLREKQVQQKCCGLQALDLQSQLFAVDEKIDPTSLLGMPKKGRIDEQFDCCKDDDDSSENICIDGEHGMKGNDAIEASQGLITSETAREKEKINDAIKEEEAIREELTTEELRMAYAAVSSLQDRMDQVDDLLESLQDEEWADEEEGFIPSTTPESNVSDDQLTLLDQILAMILGSLSQVDGSTSDEAFFLWIRQEHREIVESWAKFFGRLPKLTSSAVEQDDCSNREVETLVPSELRAVLGIDDVDGEWDELDDNSLVASDKKEKLLTHSLKPGGCLRPGGTLSK